jgi:hypothetical protein
VKTNFFGAGVVAALVARYFSTLSLEVLIFMVVARVNAGLVALYCSTLSLVIFNFIGAWLGADLVARYFSTLSFGTTDFDCF